MIAAKTKEFILRSKFRRNFLGVAAGNALAQLIVVATTPILTRIFSPAEFGIAAYALATIQMGTSATNWRFERLIPTAGSSLKRAALTRLSLIATFIVAIATALILCTLAYFEAQDSQVSTVAAFAPLIAISVFGRGIERIAQSWYVRFSQLGRVASSRIVESLSEAATSLAAGFGGLAAGGLIFAYTLSPWLGAYWLYRPRAIRRVLVRRISFRQIASYLKENFWSGTTATAASSLNSFSMNSMIIFLGLAFSLEQVALFALVRRVTLMPVLLFSKSLDQSFWAKVSSLYRKNNIQGIRTSYLRSCGYLSIVAVGISLCCILGSQLAGLVFGQNWADSGSIFLAIIPLVVGTTIFGSTNHLVVFDKQGYQLLVDGLRIILTFLSYMAAIYLNTSFWTTVLLMSVSSLCGHVSLFYLQLRIHAQTIRATHGLNSPPPV